MFALVLNNLSHNKTVYFNRSYINTHKYPIVSFELQKFYNFSKYPADVQPTGHTNYDILLNMTRYDMAVNNWRIV